MSCSTHKFGGASVRDANAIRRVGALLVEHLDAQGSAVIVVSAMGKTTNALEAVWEADASERRNLWDTCVASHVEVAQTLGLPPEVSGRLVERMESCWHEAYGSTAECDVLDKAVAYDALVAAGELASTTLVHAWLQAIGKSAVWWDVRQTISTHGPHRFARVDESTLHLAGQSLREAFLNDAGRQIVVTQGFIGRHEDGKTSTLGREGSDYSAALLAVATGSKEVTIWKDVPGMMNADPKRYPDAQTVPFVDHAEALELSYYGASVIHPRTVKPLKKAGLPLWVRSFEDPSGPCTQIDAFPGVVPEMPMFIWKDNQTWMEVYTNDGSFLAEDHLTALFGALDRAGIHVRLMQQSATHFGVLADRDDASLDALKAMLEPSFMLDVVHGMTLLTVRHGDAEIVGALTANREVVVEQRSGETWRRVLAEGKDGEHG